MKKQNNLTKLLKLGFLRYTNKTVARGIKDLPAISCNVKEYPDFFALSSEPGLYNKTERTAVTFFEYDEDFDGKFGLYWAIENDVEDRLEYFKNRFKDIRYVVLPDYSELGDVHKIENEHRLFKARVVGLWFMFEVGCVVIPNFTFPTEESSDFALDGFENSSVGCISTKGHMDNPLKKERLRKHCHIVVDKLPKLETLLVYDVCGTNYETLDVLSYATNNGVKLIIPDNTLKLRNMQLYTDRCVSRKEAV